MTRRLHRCPIQEHLIHLRYRIRSRPESLPQQSPLCQAGNNLPIRDSTIVELITCMGADQVSVCRNRDSYPSENDAHKG